MSWAVIKRAVYFSRVVIKRAVLFQGAVIKRAVYFSRAVNTPQVREKCVHAIYFFYKNSAEKK